jgi:TP901 family phage tail tape measure protein
MARAMSTNEQVINFAFRSTNQMSATLLAVQSGLNSLTAVAGSVGRGLSDAMTTAQSAALTLGTVAVMGMQKAIGAASEYQAKMAQVKAISGQSDAEVNQLGASAQQLSAKYGMSLDDITDGLITLGRAGINNAAVQTGVLEEGFKMAKLEGMDLNESLEDLITTTNLLNGSTVDMNSSEYSTQVSEMNTKLLTASQVAPLDVKNIIESLQYAGGSAAVSHMDQDNLLATISALGARGTKGALAGTALRNFMTRSITSTGENALESIGLSGDSLWKFGGNTMRSFSDMKRMLDDTMKDRGMTTQDQLSFWSKFAGPKMANQLMKIDPDQVDEYEAKIEDGINTQDEMNTILNSTKELWNEITSSIGNFFVNVGSKFLIIINPLLQVVKILTSVFSSDGILGGIMSQLFGWLGAGGLVTAIVAAGAALFNTVGPSVASIFHKAEGIRGIGKDIEEEVGRTAATINAIKNPDLLHKKARELNETEIDTIRYHTAQKGLDSRYSEPYRRRIFNAMPTYDTSIMINAFNMADLNKPETLLNEKSMKEITRDEDFSYAKYGGREHFTDLVGKFTEEHIVPKAPTEEEAARYNKQSAEEKRKQSAKDGQEPSSTNASENRAKVHTDFKQTHNEIQKVEASIKENTAAIRETSNPSSQVEKSLNNKINDSTPKTTKQTNTLSESDSRFLDSINFPKNHREGSNTREVIGNALNIAYGDIKADTGETMKSMFFSRAPKEATNQDLYKHLTEIDTIQSGFLHSLNAEGWDKTDKMVSNGKADLPTELRKTDNYIREKDFYKQNLNKEDKFLPQNLQDQKAQIFADAKFGILDNNLKETFKKELTQYVSNKPLEDLHNQLSTMPRSNISIEDQKSLLKNQRDIKQSKKQIFQDNLELNRLQNKPQRSINQNAYNTAVTQKTNLENNIAALKQQDQERFDNYNKQEKHALEVKQVFEQNIDEYDKYQKAVATNQNAQKILNNKPKSQKTLDGFKEKQSSLDSFESIDYDQVQRDFDESQKVIDEFNNTLRNEDDINNAKKQLTNKKRQITRLTNKQKNNKQNFTKNDGIKLQKYIQEKEKIESQLSSYSKSYSEQEYNEANDFLSTTTKPHKFQSSDKIKKLNQYETNFDEIINTFEAEEKAEQNYNKNLKKRQKLEKNITEQTSKMTKLEEENQAIKSSYVNGLVETNMKPIYKLKNENIPNNETTRAVRAASTILSQQPNITDIESQIQSAIAHNLSLGQNNIKNIINPNMQKNALIDDSMRDLYNYANEEKERLMDQQVAKRYSTMSEDDVVNEAKQRKQNQSWQQQSIGYQKHMANLEQQTADKYKNMTRVDRIADIRERKQTKPAAQQYRDYQKRIGIQEMLYGNKFTLNNEADIKEIKSMLKKISQDYSNDRKRTAQNIKNDAFGKTKRDLKTAFSDFARPLTDNMKKYQHSQFTNMEGTKGKIARAIDKAISFIPGYAQTAMGGGRQIKEKLGARFQQKKEQIRGAATNTGQNLAMLTSTVAPQFSAALMTGSILLDTVTSLEILLNAARTGEIALLGILNIELMAVLAPIIAIIAILVGTNKLNEKARKDAQARFKSSGDDYDKHRKKYEFYSQQINKNRDKYIDKLNLERLATQNAGTKYRAAANDEMNARMAGDWGDHGFFNTLGRVLHLTDDKEIKSRSKDTTAGISNIVTQADSDRLTTGLGGIGVIVGLVKNAESSVLGSTQKFGLQDNIRSYYYGHQKQFEEMNQYKSELSTLYNLQNSLISTGLTQKQAQNSKKFKESLNEMSQKTGLTSKQIKSYLSWMKHEQYFKQYEQQMNVRKTSIIDQMNLQTSAAFANEDVKDMKNLKGASDIQKQMLQLQALQYGEDIAKQARINIIKLHALNIFLEVRKILSWLMHGNDDKGRASINKQQARANTAIKGMEGKTNTAKNAKDLLKHVKVTGKREDLASGKQIDSVNQSTQNANAPKWSAVGTSAGTNSGTSIQSTGDTNKPQTTQTNLQTATTTTQTENQKNLKSIATTGKKLEEKNRVKLNPKETSKKIKSPNVGKTVNEVGKGIGNFLTNYHPLALSAKAISGGFKSSLDSGSKVGGFLAKNNPAILSAKAIGSLFKNKHEKDKTKDSKINKTKEQKPKKPKEPKNSFEALKQILGLNRMQSHNVILMKTYLLDISLTLQLILDFFNPLGVGGNKKQKQIAGIRNKEKALERHGGAENITGEPPIGAPIGISRGGPIAGVRYSKSTIATGGRRNTTVATGHTNKDFNPKAIKARDMKGSLDKRPHDGKKFVITGDWYINTTGDPDDMKSQMMQIFEDISERINPKVVSQTSGTPPVAASSTTATDANSTTSGVNGIQDGVTAATGDEKASRSNYAKVLSNDGTNVVLGTHDGKKIVRQISQYSFLKNAKKDNEYSYSKLNVK